MKIINVGFMTESWNVNKNIINEDEQTEMDLGDPRKQPVEEPRVADRTSTPKLGSQSKLKELVKKIKVETNPLTKKTLIRQVVDLIALDLKPEAEEIVAKFENDSLKTTRGNYGKYMQVLSGFDGVYFVAFVNALRQAGAGRGLDDAVRVIKGQ